MQETLRTIWLFVTLFGISLGQVLIGMYIAIVIYEEVFQNYDNKSVLPSSTCPCDSGVADVHFNQDNN